MDGVKKMALAWGIMCILGFAGFAFWFPGFDMINYIWVVFSVIGIYALYKWVPNAMKNNLVHAWAAITVVGMLWSFAILWKLFSSPFNYVQLWLLLMGLGFLYTGHYMKQKMWYVTGAVNLLLLVIILTKAVPVIGANALLLTGIVSGVPLVYWALFRK